MDNIIELKEINKSYYGAVETKVLHGINLQIERGSLNSIVGQSGSGKSTLMNIIGTLDQPTSGEVFINGIRIDTLSKDELALVRNQTIGFVFQFHYLLPEYSVFDNVLMPLLIKNGRARQIDADKAIEILEMVGLAEKRNVLSGKLSGGQQQRTAIARALMNDPDIVLADEPTGNLDSDTSARIHRLFCKINRELKHTFIIITHDDRIAQQTNRIIEIDDGRISSDIQNVNNAACTDDNAGN